MTEMGSIAAISVIGVVLLFSLAVSVLGIANYIITSLSLYTLAERRGISNPWLAWLPIGSSWILGSVSDKHDENIGVRRRWRVTLIILELLGGAGAFATVFAMIALVFVFGFSGEEMAVTASAIGILILLYLIYFLAILASTAFGFCRIICMYKIFEVTAPEKAIKYILLSMLVPLANAICLMKCKDSMLGIPQTAATE